MNTLNLSPMTATKRILLLLVLLMSSIYMMAQNCSVNSDEAILICSDQFAQLSNDTPSKVLKPAFLTLIQSADSAQINITLRSSRIIF